MSVMIFLINLFFINNHMMRPLSEQLRPQKLEEIKGQDHLVGKEGLLTKLISNQYPVSILLWGPPGCGKTTIAKLYAKAFSLESHYLSPIHHGIQEIKKLVDDRNSKPLFSQKPLMVFVDEIHRFNKAQQDFFLPYLENGSLLLVGATTENPSFALNHALLSRLRVFTLQSLSESALENILEGCLTKHPSLSISTEAKASLVHMSQGDARYLCNLLESCLASGHLAVNQDNLTSILEYKPALYDKQGEQHYNLISALHKSIRGSDPQAALYYLSRMLQAGEDPHFIARRLVRAASEDIGLADPHALQIALQSWEAFKQLGSPEGDLALVQCAIYLALAPKSNALYKAYNLSKEHAKATSHLPPPMHILNAPTQLMKDLGYSQDYLYDHETPEGFSGQDYFPEGLESTCYYTPIERGFERELLKRLNYFKQLKNRKRPK